jgi:release factor glutamine methyltransferase
MSLRLDQLVRNCADAIATAQHSDSARLDAELLVLHVLEKPRSFLYSHPEFIINADQLAAVNHLVQRRCDGIPVAYLLGQKEFWSLMLKVDERVLIPRPETEAIIDYILQLNLPEQASVIDLGTGSGAIALALASEKPNYFVVASDYSEGALSVAKNNVQQLAANGACHEIPLLRGDWLSALAKNSFDLVVSNPPYIDAQDPHLQQGDVRFEPLSALVSKDSGYDDIKLISRQAKACLKSGGHLIIEHGYDQREAITKIVEAEGYLNVLDHDDLNAMPRFITAINS